MDEEQQEDKSDQPIVPEVAQGMELNQFSIRKIEYAIKSTRNDGVPGPNGLPSFLFKRSPADWTEKLSHLFNSAYQLTIIPDSWRGPTLCPVHKRGDRSVASNYGLVALLYVNAKMYAQSPLGQLEAWVQEHQIRRFFPSGFRSRDSTVDNIVVLAYLQRQAVTTNHLPLFCCFVDYSAAFERVDRDTLWRKLSRFMNNSKQGVQPSEFILLGLSNVPEVQTYLFVVFLVCYITTIMGDTYIMTLVALDPRLHNPMYFFLVNFSCANIFLTTVVMPQFLINLCSRKQAITLARCFTQLFFYILTANLECLLLAVMAYDRYAAICNPLRYSLVITRQVCCKLVIASWVITLLHALLFTGLMTQLSFCASNQLHHFFCDIPPLLELSCSDTSTYELWEYTEGTTMVACPLLFIITSYCQVIATILKIRSVEGRHKAFSTCSSHLTLVSLFYGSIFFMYFRPTASFALDYDRVLSVVYSVIIPMLNPFIYSLRNQDMKKAFQKVRGQINTEIRQKLQAK
ncbi:olfactory receptor 1468-like [Pleurodeles waltl]|uniref:olfactory receptor 1468-like n=1 Tax=Pleurodeles waltl TaxID=8319 RepID=UPI0037096AF6